jgi:hypothetical protein
LIVILLLSLFAFLVFGAVKRRAVEPERPKVSQIRELLTREGGERELVCIENCQRCFFLGSDHQLHESALHFPPIAAYIVDPSDQAVRLEYGRWRDKPVCLRIRAYANGSVDRMILESEGKFYFIPSYFGAVEEFPGLGEATERWLQHRGLFQDRGDYY